MPLVRASRWPKSRLTPSPLKPNRLKPKRLNLKPLGGFLGRPLGLAAALVAAAGLVPRAAAQPVLAANERGDLALVPYYTVRGQWVTGIHIVNTSERTQVVKVRFRRATDGLDALDFNVVMSPEDVYAGFLSDDENGAMAWASPDTSCTAPATQGNRLMMPSIYRAGAESGYVEIIAMGQPINENQPIAVAAKHSVATSMPLDCAAVRSNFFADGSNTAGAEQRGVLSNSETYQPGIASASDISIKNGGVNTYTDSGNVLKVSYFIRDNGTGIEFGDHAVHIADFLDVPAITNQQYGITSGDLNGFDFPDLDGTGLPRGATGSSPALVRNRFNLLRQAPDLGVKSMINEWSANPANGVQMDWVLTLPGQYTMLRLPQYLKSLGSDGAWVSTVDGTGRPVVNPQCPRQAIAADSATGAAAVDACDFRDLPVKLTYAAYNREEFRGAVSAGTLVVSPQPPSARAETYLTKVANVIGFGGRSVLGQTDADVTANLGQPFGWVVAQLKPQKDPKVCRWDPSQDSTSPSAAAADELTLDCTTTDATGHAPVIGFAAWSRQVAANPDASYGRIVEHSYERARTVPGTVFRDTLKDGGQGPQMVALPTGSFSMGSPSGEAGRYSGEGPVRTVTISKRLAMGRYEVTFADYERFAAHSSRNRPSDQGWGRGRRPVINVSQEDAQAYAAWLSDQTGKRYRLPSEAEWEYAARAGTSTRYSWGDSIACSQASYGLRSGGPCNTGGDINLARTAVVGRFAANAFGLYDMHGNVREWVEDCYVDTYIGAPTDGSARDTDCGSRIQAVVRGGAWRNNSRSLRSAYRGRNGPSASNRFGGFRLVQDLSP